MNSESLRRSSVLKENAKRVGTRGSEIDQVVKIQEEVEADLPMVLEEARYTASLHELPVDEEGYGLFREIVASKSQVILPQSRN